MTELFTIIAFAVNFIITSAFAMFAPTAAAGASWAQEHFADANSFEGRVVARIRMRNARSEVSRDIGKSTEPYWGRSIF